MKNYLFRTGAFLTLFGLFIAYAAYREAAEIHAFIPAIEGEVALWVYAGITLVAALICWTGVVRDESRWNVISVAAICFQMTMILIVLAIDEFLRKQFPILFIIWLYITVSAYSYTRMSGITERSEHELIDTLKEHQPSTPPPEQG